jgi:hypothetical protein
VPGFISVEPMFAYQKKPELALPKIGITKIWFATSLSYGLYVPKEKYTHLMRVCDRMLLEKLDNSCTQNGNL